MRKIKEQIQITGRCYNKELSGVEEKLERMISVGNMVEIDDVYDIEVTENPCNEVTVVVEDVLVPKTMVEPVPEAIIEAYSVIVSELAKHMMNLLKYQTVPIICRNEMEFSNSFHKK